MWHEPQQFIHMELISLVGKQGKELRAAAKSNQKTLEQRIEGLEEQQQVLFILVGLVTVLTLISWLVAPLYTIRGSLLDDTMGQLTDRLQNLLREVAKSDARQLRELDKLIQRKLPPN